MRIKFLIAGLLGLVTATAFAQKGELKDAKESYDKYSTLSRSGAGAMLANASLASAKKSIDNAAGNAKTSGLPETYALKGAIYASLALADTSVSRTAPLFATADEALKKAKELDTKVEYKKIIDDAHVTLAQYQLNKGVKEFKQKKYDLAYSSFDYYRQTLPEDTNAIYYTGLSAASSGKYPEAVSNYTKLLTTKFSQKPAIYFELSSIYLTQKDTSAALKITGEGIQKYPTNADLRKREIEISLQTGKQQEVLSKIQSAIVNDPKNKMLYYYAGLTNGLFAEGVAKEIAKTKDAATKATLQAKRADYFGKAADFYKKAIEIDPGYFEANLNLGYVMLSPAIDQYNAANQLPVNKQKEYDAAIIKATAQFELAKPYLLKAVELNPTSVDALANLKTYYLGTKNPAQATETQKKIDAIK
ncbi:hypothetical protein [Mucilaginibacter sp.]|uniref:tetratricopeptide repeat protein n=1 Tax=Mucilaginibacter sp. TaxID=1882438 RepID=UPI0026383BE1|nr:hypothetical protein [Mucilaginibacter sp.]MDB5032476.1 hypothetical protein [Mucilaginibacter sp.]